MLKKGGAPEQSDASITPRPSVPKIGQRNRRLANRTRLLIVTAPPPARPVTFASDLLAHRPNSGAGSKAGLGAQSRSMTPVKRPLLHPPYKSRALRRLLFVCP